MNRKKTIRKGLSLMETIIAIAIFSLGIIGFTLLFSNTWKSNVYVYETAKASLSASQGVSNMVNYVRKTRQGDDGAYPIKLAAANELILFSDYDRDGATERLHFYRSGSQLLMGVRKPSAGLPKSYAEGDESSILIAENAANGANEPIFRYYNNNYPADRTNNPLTLPIIVWNVRLIEIFVRIDSGRGPANGVELRSFVELRNLNDYTRLTS